LNNHESYAIGVIDLVDSTGYYPEGGDPLGKEAKRRHNEIAHHIFTKFNQESEPPKGDGFLFWGKDPIQSCLAAIDVIKRIKTEVIHHSTEDKQYNMATKIVLTKGLIETKEDEKDLTHGQAAHKCQRIMEAAWQKHHTVLIDSQVFDEIKSHVSDTDIIYSGPYQLQVEEFGEIEVYQISDKELGLIVDPTRIKLQNKIKTLVKNQVEEELEERLKTTKISIEKSTKVKLTVMSIAIALLASSLVLVLTIYPGSNDNFIYQNELEFTTLKIQEESKNTAMMIYETSKNEIMRKPLLTTHTENYPIMIPENYPEEKSRIDLIKTVVNGMDSLYYLFVIPSETWNENLQCRLYVIYPVGALIPGEAPDFLQQRDWCENKANFEMYLSSAYYSRGQKEIVTTMIIPILDDDLQKVGYLAGAINFNKILKESIEDSKMSDFGYILVDHDNCIVATKFKTDSSIGDIVHFRDLHTFNSGIIDLATTDVSCKNGNSILNPKGQIQTMFDEHSKFNGWNYETIFLNQPEILKPDIDTNNFLEDWKLIVIQP
jgi:hypothetical protein